MQVSAEKAERKIFRKDMQMRFLEVPFIQHGIEESLLGGADTVSWQKDRVDSANLSAHEYNPLRYNSYRRGAR